MLYICEIYMIAIWCNILVYDYNIHIRVAIYKRYVEHGYTQNMNGNMSNMLRYLQYVRYVRYAPGVRYRPPIHGKSAWIQAVVVASSSIWQSTVIPWRRSRPTRLSAFVRFQRSWSCFQTRPPRRLVVTRWSSSSTKRSSGAVMLWISDSRSPFSADAGGDSSDEEQDLATAILAGQAWWDWCGVRDVFLLYNYVIYHHIAFLLFSYTTILRHITL